MKKQFFNLILICSLLFSTGAIAMTSQEIDFNEPSTLIIWLTPLITLVGTWIIKKIPQVSGTITLIVVPILSALIAWFSGVLMEDTSNWTEKFLAGLGSVLIHQLYKHFSGKE